MGLIYSDQTVELREVVLRDKPPSLLEYSPKATVPVLVLPSGQVIDESIDVMRWSLDLSDPDGWLAPDSAEMIDKFDHGFKGTLGPLQILKQIRSGKRRERTPLSLRLSARNRAIASSDPLSFRGQTDLS